MRRLEHNGAESWRSASLMKSNRRIDKQTNKARQNNAVKNDTHHRMRHDHINNKQRQPNRRLRHIRNQEEAVAKRLLCVLDDADNVHRQAEYYADADEDCDHDELEAVGGAVALPEDEVIVGVGEDVVDDDAEEDEVEEVDGEADGVEGDEHAFHEVRGAARG